jgi:hypothetical protein
MFVNDRLIEKEKNKINGIPKARVKKRIGIQRKGRKEERGKKNNVIKIYLFITYLLLLFIITIW